MMLKPEVPTGGFQFAYIAVSARRKRKITFGRNTNQEDVSSTDAIMPETGVMDF